MNYIDETDSNGTRFVIGDDGGRLTFYPDGTVRVMWVWSAALASDYGAGKRSDSSSFTSARKGKPPAVSEDLELALEVRRDADFFNLPEDYRDPSAKEFSAIHKGLAWRMLRAVATGDADALNTLAEAVKMASSLTNESRLNASPWAEIAEAIRSAAAKKKDIPKRSEVVAEYKRAVAVNCQAIDLRDRLARMGFGWLPAPGGRPTINPK